MALPELCPKCGERATNEQGKCVFCGTQVTHPSAILSPDQKTKSLANYKFASWAFVVLGFSYLGIGIVASIAYKSPMLGLFATALVSIGQGSFLLANNEWMQSITKGVCIGKMLLYLLLLSWIIPFLLLFLVPGIILILIVSFDIICLLIMMKAIDDIYLG